MQPIPVLVVEDEAPIRRGLCDVLVFHGLQPTGVSDGPEGLREALTGEYPLLLLDVMLPGLDGFSICEQVRERHPGVAILMLTAKGTEGDVLRGFAAGADDYVTKPFSVAQLVARVQALLRRSAGGSDQRFLAGGVQIDPARLVARLGARHVELTARDVQLLQYLAARTGVAVRRSELLADVWGYARTEGVETRCVDMHVAKLRKKLHHIGADTLIETVRGAGYRVSLG